MHERKRGQGRREGWKAREGGCGIDQVWKIMRKTGRAKRRRRTVNDGHGIMATRTSIFSLSPSLSVRSLDYMYITS